MGIGPFFNDIGGNGIALTIFALTLIIFFNWDKVIVEIKLITVWVDLNFKSLIILFPIVGVIDKNTQSHLSTISWLSLAIITFLNFCFKLLKKQDGIGGGDFLLLGGIGSLVGPISLAPVIFIGSLATLFVGLIGKYDLKKELPLASGFIIGLLIYLLIKFFELSLFGLVL